MNGFEFGDLCFAKGIELLSGCFNCQICITQNMVSSHNGPKAWQVFGINNNYNDNTNDYVEIVLGME